MVDDLEQCGDDVFWTLARHSDAFAAFLKANFVRKEQGIDRMPRHYQGDGEVSCMRSMRSMNADSHLTPDAAFWRGSAFKYLWRFERKNGTEDVDKAIDCLQKLRKELDR